jgi:type I restriction enzyme M protein
MTTKRTLLEVLTRDELVAIVDAFELQADRRSKVALADAVAASKKATLSAILPDFSRDRLKELCRALDLDDSGKDKAVLIDRLTGAKPVAASPTSKTNGASKVTPEQVELALGEKLTIDRLERYLWSAADILRGSIDSSDYKGFIFGFLFLKRLSDRFDEEVDALKGVKGADPEDPDEHDFFVPRRARWAEIQKVATAVGETLNKPLPPSKRRTPSSKG